MRGVRPAQEVLQANATLVKHSLNYIKATASRAVQSDSQCIKTLKTVSHVLRNALHVSDLKIRSVTHVTKITIFLTKHAWPVTVVTSTRRDRCVCPVQRNVRHVIRCMGVKSVKKSSSFLMRIVSISVRRKVITFLIGHPPSDVSTAQPPVVCVLLSETHF